MALGLDKHRQLSEAGEAITDYLKEKQHEMKMKRLQALQDDNFFGVAAPKDDDDDGDDFVPDDDEDGGGAKKRGKVSAVASAKKKKKKPAHLMKPLYVVKSLKLLAEAEEQAAAGDPSIMTYTRATLPDSKWPRRRFCCVCGLLAPYKCTKCQQGFCCAKCDSTHIETRCLKFTR